MDDECRKDYIWFIYLIPFIFLWVWVWGTLPLSLPLLPLSPSYGSIEKCLRMLAILASFPANRFCAYTTR